MSRKSILSAPEVPTSPKAVKADSGKPPMGLIDPVFKEEMARVLGFGENKYGEKNWLNGEGLNWSRLIDAAERHLDAFKQGVENDDETNLSHLAHCACCLMMLRYYERNDCDFNNDDRRWDVQ